jgi:hypothetical protein
MPNVTIGALTFDDYEGLFQPRGVTVEVEEGQHGGVKLKNKMIGNKPFTIKTISQVASEAAAITLITAANKYIGAYKWFTVGGLTTRCRVNQMESRYRKIASAAATAWMVELTWQGGPGKPQDSADETYLPVEVESSPDFWNWTQHVDLRVSGLMEGHGRALGTCVLVQNPVDDSHPLEVVLGKYIRVRIPNDLDLSKIEDKADVLKWSQWFYYICFTEDIAQVDPGSEEPTREATWNCVGLEMELDTQLSRWYEWTNELKGDFSSPGCIPPVNGRPDGDKDGAAVSIAGRTVYVHHRNMKPGAVWNNRQFTETLLAGAEDQTVGSSKDYYNGYGPQFYLGGLVAALQNTEEHHVDGMTVLEILNTVIGHGLGWHLRVDDTVAGNELNCYLDITSPLQNALTCADLTIPAAAQQTRVDLTDLAVTGDWALGEDTTRMADHIIIEGAKAWRGLSLEIAGNDLDGSTNLQLVRNWTSADATDWDAASDTGKDCSKLGHVWRSFKLHGNYRGGRHNNNDDKFPSYYQTKGTDDRPDLLCGAGGETGTKQEQIGGFEEWAEGCWVNYTISDIVHTMATDTNTGDFNFPASAVELTEYCPFPEGEDWTTVTQTSAPELDTRVPGAKATLYRRKAVDDNGVIAYLYDRLFLDLEINDREVRIGRSPEDAALVKHVLEHKVTIDAVDYYDSIVVTCGMRGPKPWRVGWKRVSWLRSRAIEKTVIIRYPELEWRWLHKDTILGVNDDGSAKKNASPGPLLDMGEKGKGLLLLARLWHENALRDLTWTVDGRLETDTAQQPGTLITSALIPAGKDDPPEDRPVLAQVQRRSWNLRRDAACTIYQCATTLPEITPVIRAPSSNMWEMTNNLLEYSGQGMRPRSEYHRPGRPIPEWASWLAAYKNIHGQGS